jgi:hypothetical protein
VKVTPKFRVISPDGIADRPEPYQNRDDAERGKEAFVERFRRQGFYLDAHGIRISFTELALFVEVEEVDDEAAGKVGTFAGLRVLNVGDYGEEAQEELKVLQGYVSYSEPLLRNTPFADLDELWVVLNAIHHCGDEGIITGDLAHRLAKDACARFLIFA